MGDEPVSKRVRMCAFVRASARGDICVRMCIFANLCTRVGSHLVVIDLDRIAF